MGGESIRQQFSIREDLTVNDIQTVLERFPAAHRDALIPILQDIQEQQGYLSREAVTEVGRHLKLPVSKIYGVATFYNQFTFQPRGRFHIQVCRGTACHVKGSAKVLETFQRELNAKAGQTTPDGLFSLEVVSCIGACGLAPTCNIDGEIYAGMSPEKVRNIINTYRSKAANNETKA
jgi:NADH-quinone oxidoreductase E subunit